MRPSVIAICAGSLVLVLFSTVGLGHWQAQRRAANVANYAGNSLNLNLRTFDGPVRAGNFILGTETFHWERKTDDAVLERVTYLPVDQRFCWGKLEAGIWKDHGCINTAPFEE
jgi:hypothetical protein